jgi:two-component system chemotaxis response regulator CheB
MIELLFSQKPEFKVVGTAADGLECLQKLAELNPDLITLDINMPRMDGLETLQEIRKVSNVPVVIISALVPDTEELAMQLTDFGANAYVLKNFGNEVIGLAAFECELFKSVDKALSSYNQLLNE